MYRSKSTHVCALEEEISDYGMYHLPPDATWFQRWWRIFRKTFTISEVNPRSTEFYRCQVEIIVKRKEHLETYPYIIHPFSIFRIFYEMFITLVFIAALIFAPLNAAFDSFLHDDEDSDFIGVGFEEVEFFLAILCSIDIFMNFLTGYEDTKRKEVILAPWKIAKNYIIGIHFFCDTLSMISLLHGGRYQLHHLFDWFGMLRMSRLPTVFEYINRAAETMKTAFKIIRYSVVTFIVFHCFACLLVLAPQVRDLFQYSEERVLTVEQDTWFMRMDEETNETLLLDVNEISDLYIYGLYRSISFLLSIETQLEISMNHSDIVMEAISLLFGKIFFLFMTVVILRMIMSKRSLETKYYETMNQVEGYMRNKQLPPEMQKKILTYYEYKYNRRYFKESNITNMFSDVLKKEINLHVCKDLVHKVNLFESLPQKFVEDILAQLKAEIFLPNDLIIKAGSYGDCMYFLARGTVAVSTPSGREICHLEDGAYFGEICLIFKEKKRTANVVALEICEVFRLEKKGFHNIFSKQSDLSEKLEAVANQRLADTALIEDSCKQKLFGKIL